MLILFSSLCFSLLLLSANKQPTSFSPSVEPQPSLNQQLALPSFLLSNSPSAPFAHFPLPLGCRKFAVSGGSILGLRSYS
uniref:Uncharacterized protein n=1 Tax=Setaria viridis TaxID=4556 RepID=A0A4U6T004_SETVI|nr:hypothetical protein SEVIR_9G322666v2 [Setaria viridis]